MTRIGLTCVGAIRLCLFAGIGLSGCDGGFDDGGSPPVEDLDRIGQAVLDQGSSSDPGWYYQLKSVSNAMCADVEGRSLVDDARVIQFGCSAGSNQRFYFRSLSASTYQLSAQHSARCIRSAGGSASSGAGIVQDFCARSGTEQTGTVWSLRAVGSASPTQYQIVAANGRCLRSPNTTSGSGLVQSTCSTSSSFLWTLQRVAAVPGSDSNGRWSGVIGTSNVIAASAAVLPNRKVLLFASWKGTSFAGSGSLDQTVTALFDPGNNTTVVKTVTNTAHNMFCPGTAMLSDGRLLVSGGDDQYTTANSIYNPATDSWTTGAPMRERRWYNTSVTLADGRVLTLGGNRTTGATGDGEIYNPSTNTWTFMSGIDIGALTAGTDAATSRTMEHPRLILAPDGRVFAPGPSPHMKLYSTSGSGSVSSAGDRSDDETSQNDITVVYDIGKLLKAGGNPSYDRATPAYWPSSQYSYLIDFNGFPTVTKVAPMKYPRNFANGVVLPDGTIFVAGGLDNAKGFSDDGKILPAELFDPRTRTWKELPATAVARPYHSIAVLLPDARVLVGGGGLCPGNDSCSVNHPNVEIFSPSYLFAGTRPTISAPSTVTANGGSFEVTVGGTVTRFTLVRMSSVTHSVNTDQRLIPLASSGTGTTRTLTAPANKNIAPPGYYMLFALDGDIPSVAAIVRII
jgi:galactose oxidase